jgi:hypothetical protein
LTTKSHTSQYKDMDMNFMPICNPAEISLVNRPSTYISLNLYMERYIYPALDRFMESLLSEGAS